MGEAKRRRLAKCGPADERRCAPPSLGEWSIGEPEPEPAGMQQRASRRRSPLATVLMAAMALGVPFDGGKGDGS